MKSKIKSNHDYLNDAIRHVIKYHGESFSFERATKSSPSVMRQLRSGYGKRGYKVHFSKWKEDRKVILVYVSELHHPEIIRRY
jgi:hypothetical protein